MSDITGFRRTLVGLKHTIGPSLARSSAGFRRTLVGLKQYALDWQSTDTEFQTNPCGVEAASTFPSQSRVDVSDEPLWG